MIKNISHFCLVLSLLLSPVISVADDLAVIVHNENQQALNLKDVRRIFLGKQRHFPDGRSATPIQLPVDDELYPVFSEKILAKSPSQLRAYWAKRIFTGKGRPPNSADDQVNARVKVSRHIRYISYVGAENVDSSVHSVVKIKLD